MENKERCLYHKEMAKGHFDALKPIWDISCNWCGICIAICPQKKLTIKAGKMVNTAPEKKCPKECGLCYIACPRSFMPLADLEKKNYFKEPDDIYEERLGPYRDIFIGKSLVDPIWRRGTPGGVTTGLLYYLLENGYVDAVLCTKGVHDGKVSMCIHSKPIVTSDLNVVTESAGSKYDLSPIFTKLSETRRHKKVAVVGSPCHNTAFKKLKLMMEDEDYREIFPKASAAIKKLISNIAYMISINCYCAMRPEGTKHFTKKMGIDEKKLVKFNERVYRVVFDKFKIPGEQYNWAWCIDFSTLDCHGVFTPYTTADYLEFVAPSCFVCQDNIVSRFADISIGITGSVIEGKPKEYGWNSVIIRSKGLKEIVDKMVKEEKFERLPMPRGDTQRREKFIDILKQRVIDDHIGAEHYMKTGNWNLTHTTSDLLFNACLEIVGKESYILFQDFKKIICMDHLWAAARKHNRFLTDFF